MIKTGLTSVTFRQLSADDVISFCKRGGLSCIEWGGDIHVPVNNPGNAITVAEKTAASGLSVCSYGSYYNVGAKCDYTFSDCLEAAKQLGAPVIRLWGGECSSSQATPQYRRKLVCETRAACDAAAKYNIDIAFEFHNNTLCDNCESALSLVKEIDRSNFGLYFQYDPFQSVAENCNTLRHFLPYLKMVHVFNVDKEYRHISLADGNGLMMWRCFIEILKQANINIQLLIEFLPQADLEGLKREAELLNNLVEEVQS